MNDLMRPPSAPLLARARPLRFNLVRRAIDVGFVMLVGRVLGCGR
jgi:hypothetical protein